MHAMKHRLATFLLSAAAASAFAAAPAPAAPAADAAAPAFFSAEERDLLLDLSKDVTAALAKSGIRASVPVSALPFPGDRERYLEGLLKNAVTGAGLNYVEGRDDPMWDAIVSEIIWDWHKNDVLDADTLTKFGRLQATRQLLYGRLFLERTTNDLPRAELWLHVSSVETKQHVWGQVFVRERKPEPKPEPKPVMTFVDFPVVLADALLRVRVDSVPADKSASSATLSDALASDTRDALAAAGFAVLEGEEAKDAEIAVSLKSAAKPFDREDDYVRFDGTSRLVASLPADRDRVLGETEIRKPRAKRALGDDAALANLHEEFVAPLRAWLGETVTVEKTGLRSVALQVDFIKLDEPELEQRVATLVDALAKLAGVRDARVVSRLPLPDGKPGTRLTLRVLFRPVDVPEGIATRLVAQRPDLFKKAVPAK